MHVSFQQLKGKWNPDYWTAIFWWSNEDRHFFLRRDKDACNWMPKHDEIELILESIMQVEGTDKREHLKSRFIAAIERGYSAPNSFNK